MSTATIRYYHSTLAYRSSRRTRRIEDFKKTFRTKVSRRKMKQYIHTALNHISHE